MVLFRKMATSVWHNNPRRNQQAEVAHCIAGLVHIKLTHRCTSAKEISYIQMDKSLLRITLSIDLAFTSNGQYSLWKSCS